jgi:putative glycosyltransferase (TIGR04348 family)
MIALHAWRSAEAIASFRARYPARPLVVALTGTDLYRYLHSHAETTLHSIELADRLVVLHMLAHEALPAWARDKVQVIYQSARPLPSRGKPATSYFDVCVAGHLREEKDPLRAAFAVRGLPPASRIRVLHYGKAYDDHWAQAAREEMARNARYRWLGEVPYWQLRRAYARCRLMVLSSIMEGGANVVSEAVVARLPLIVSEISGSIGLLGADYPGYFPVGDTRALQAQLARAEAEPEFLQQLARHCSRRESLFRPEREAAAWRDLLAGLNQDKSVTRGRVAR